MARVTIAEILTELGDLLKTEGATEIPSQSQMARALNRAKDDLVERIAEVDKERFIARKDYTVASGDTYITLPDGSGADAAWTKLLGIEEWQGSEYQGDVPVYPRPSAPPHDCDLGYWMYREGHKLYFNDDVGIDHSCTLRVRYVAAVADIDPTTLTNTFDLPDNWTHAMILQAAVDLLPASSPGQRKLLGRLREKLAMLEDSASRAVRTRGPLAIRNLETEIY